MFLVGLTGGIATGKSTASKRFKELGCTVINSDELARKAQEPGTPAWRKMRAAFGDSVFLPDGSLDRAQLGDIIFNDPAQRKRLNAIVHPYILRLMLWECLIAFLKGEQFVILELPLLFEVGSVSKYLGEIAVVHCEDQSQLSRLMKRNSLSEDEARARITSQLPQKVKVSGVTHPLCSLPNNGATPAELHDRVDTLVTFLRSGPGTLRGQLLHWVFSRTTVACLVALLTVVLGQGLTRWIGW